MTLAKLFILGQEIELLWTDMNYHRDTRINGKPASDTNGGLITLCYVTDRYSDLVLNWMTKKNEDETWNEVDKMEQGKICFYENGFEYPPTKTYKFEDAHLIYFREIFFTEGTQPMQTILTISPAIQNYGTDLVKRWNHSWIPPSERMPYQAIENNEEYDEQIKVIDKNGNPVSDLFYCVEFENKIITTGRTDKNGLVKRVNQSQNQKNYNYFWGDEAFLKSQNS